MVETYKRSSLFAKAWTTDGKKFYDIGPWKRFPVETGKSIVIKVEGAEGTGVPHHDVL